MAKSKLHPLAKKLGFKTNKEFYQIYPTQEAYEMAMGGSLRRYPGGGPTDPIPTDPAVPIAPTTTTGLVPVSSGTGAAQIPNTQGIYNAPGATREGESFWESTNPNWGATITAKTAIPSVPATPGYQYQYQDPRIQQRMAQNRGYDTPAAWFASGKDTDTTSKMMAYNTANPPLQRKGGSVFPQIQSANGFFSMGYENVPAPYQGGSFQDGGGKGVPLKIHDSNVAKWFQGQPQDIQDRINSQVNPLTGELMDPGVATWFQNQPQAIKDQIYDTTNTEYAPPYLYGGSPGEVFHAAAPFPRNGRQAYGRPTFGPQFIAQMGGDNKWGNYTQSRSIPNTLIPQSGASYQWPVSPNAPVPGGGPLRAAPNYGGSYNLNYNFSTPSMAPADTTQSPNKLTPVVSSKKMGGVSKCMCGGSRMLKGGSCMKCGGYKMFNGGEGMQPEAPLSFNVNVNKPESLTTKIPNLSAFIQRTAGGVIQNEMDAEYPIPNDGMAMSKHGGNPAMASYHNLSQQDYNAMYDQMYAHGGPTGYPEMFEDAMPYEYKEGGIYIKPSKRGTFTKAAKKRGQSVQGFASKVLANKTKYSKAMIKKANFARNAASWKKEEGGEESGEESIMNEIMEMYSQGITDVIEIADALNQKGYEISPEDVSGMLQSVQGQQLAFGGYAQDGMSMIPGAMDRINQFDSAVNKAEQNANVMSGFGNFLNTGANAYRNRTLDITTDQDTAKYGGALKKYQGKTAGSQVTALTEEEEKLAKQYGINDPGFSPSGTRSTIKQRQREAWIDTRMGEPNWNQMSMNDYAKQNPGWRGGYNYGQYPINQGSYYNYPMGPNDGYGMFPANSNSQIIVKRPKTWINGVQQGYSGSPWTAGSSAGFVPSGNYNTPEGWGKFRSNYGRGFLGLGPSRLKSIDYDFGTGTRPDFEAKPQGTIVGNKLRKMFGPKTQKEELREQVASYPAPGAPAVQAPGEAGTYEPSLRTPDVEVEDAYDYNQGAYVPQQWGSSSGVTDPAIISQMNALQTGIASPYGMPQTGPAPSSSGPAAPTYGDWRQTGIVDKNLPTEQYTQQVDDYLANLERTNPSPTRKWFLGKKRYEQKFGGMPRYQGDEYGSQVPRGMGDRNMTTYFDTTGNMTGNTLGSTQADIAAGNQYQVSKDSQFNQNDNLYGATQAYTKSIEQQNADQGSMRTKGTLKFKNRMDGEDAANWAIAGTNLAANIFSQDELRGAEEDAAQARQITNWMPSQQTENRGFNHPITGQEQPDNYVNVGNFIGGSSRSRGNSGTVGTRFGGSLKMGGTYTGLTDQELQDLRDGGYEFEILD